MKTSPSVTLGKEIKDYLHLYMAHQCRYKYTDQEEWSERQITPTFLNDFHGELRNLQIQIILRPSWDITDPERLERGKAISAYGNNLIDAEYHRWMFSKGFDLFGLIEAGLAIDKTKMT